MVSGRSDQGVAVDEGAEDFPDGEVEGVGVELAPHLGGFQGEQGAGGGEQADEVGLGDEDAFGGAGGAGGVDEVGRVARVGGFGPLVQRQVGGGQLLQAGGGAGIVEQEAGRGAGGGRGQGAVDGGGGDHGGGGAVVQEVVDAFAG